MCQRHTANCEQTVNAPSPDGDDGEGQSGGVNLYSAGGCGETEGSPLVRTKDCGGLGGAKLLCGNCPVGSVGATEVIDKCHLVVPRFLYCTYIIAHLNRFVKGFSKIFFGFVVGIIPHFFSRGTLVHIYIPQTYTPCGKRVFSEEVLCRSRGLPLFVVASSPSVII